MAARAVSTEGHVLLGGGYHITSLQERTKNAVLLPAAGGTDLAEGQIPDCGPDHSEVTAEP